MKVHVGDNVTVGKQKGRVTATSGTDNQCIVELAEGDVRYTGWIDADKVEQIPTKEEGQERTL